MDGSPVSPLPDLMALEGISSEIVMADGLTDETRNMCVF
jgi:hypothetical protein